MRAKENKFMYESDAELCGNINLTQKCFVRGRAVRLILDIVSSHLSLHTQDRTTFHVQDTGQTHANRRPTDEPAEML